MMESTAQRDGSHNNPTSRAPSSGGHSAMSIQNGAAAEGGTNAVGGGTAPPNGAGSAQNPKSVVPQLMDIYDDLAQSSTPQTVNNGAGVAPMPALPQVSAKGSYYSSSYDSASPDAAGAVAARRASQQHASSLASTASVLSSVRSRRAATAQQQTSKKTKAETELDDSGRSMGSTSRKKGKSSNTDQRWSKRFTWPDEVRIVFY